MTRHIRAAAVFAGVLLSAWPVAAQNSSDRPYRGLFGGGGADPSLTHSLGLQVSLIEAYDDNVSADAGGNPTAFERAGFYSGLTTNADYTWRTHRVQVGAAVGTNLRYYGTLGRVTGINHYVSGGFTAQLGPRTTLFMNESVTYAPAYLYALFTTPDDQTPGAPPPGGADYATSDQRSLTYDSSANLSHNLTRHTALSFSSDVRYTDYVGGSGALSDLRAYDVGGHFTYAASRDATLRLGYTYRRGQYQGGLRPVEHGIDIGLDYDKPLSRSRRTTVSFSVGTTVLQGPLPGVGDPGDASDRRQFRVQGRATLNHDMGRTWRAQVNYSRGLGLIEGLGEPVFTDGVTVTVGGLMTRRFDFLSTAAYTTGEAALAGTAPQFSTYTGTARLRYALTRTWAAYAEYVYYFYEFNPELRVLPGVPRGLERNGVRVGLTLWVPLLRR